MKKKFLELQQGKNLKEDTESSSSLSQDNQESNDGIEIILVKEEEKKNLTKQPSIINKHKIKNKCHRHSKMIKNKASTNKKHKKNITGIKKIKHCNSFQKKRKLKREPQINNSINEMFKSMAGKQTKSSCLQNEIKTNIEVMELTDSSEEEEENDQEISNNGLSMSDSKPEDNSKNSLNSSSDKIDPLKAESNLNVANSQVKSTQFLPDYEKCPSHSIPVNEKHSSRKSTNKMSLTPKSTKLRLSEREVQLSVKKKKLTPVQKQKQIEIEKRRQERIKTKLEKQKLKEKEAEEKIKLKEERKKRKQEEQE